MTVTLVLRLLLGPLSDNELVGSAEIVATGESHPVRGTDDLIAVARAAARRTSDPASGEPAPESAPESPSDAGRPG